MKKLDIPLWVWALLGFLIGVVISLLIGCGSPSQSTVETAPGAEPPKLYITVRNTTDHEFFGMIRAGLLSRTITVPANGESSFWGYRTMIPERLTLEVLPKAPEARRK